MPPECRELPGSLVRCFRRRGPVPVRQRGWLDHRLIQAIIQLWQAMSVDRLF
jgi:hypothetical protein